MRSSKLYVVALVAAGTMAAPVTSSPGMAAAPNAAAVAAVAAVAIERPSIMQAEDRAHIGQQVQLSADVQRDGRFVNAQPRTGTLPTEPAARGPRAFNNGGLSREVFGFAPYWSLSSGALSDVQFDKVSTVNYFGLTYTAPGTFDPSDAGASGWNSQALTTFINQAHAAGDRAVVTVKSFDNGTIGSIVNNPTNGQAAIDSAINAMVSRSLDGVNVDFEGSDATMQQAFTNWIANLSSQLHARYPSAFLSVDTYSGAASWSGGFMRIDTLAPHVDAFFIMAYDMGISNALDQGRPHTLPNAPLAGSYTFTDTQSVDQYVAKAGDRTKVILGVPYYGYKTSTVSTAFNSTRNTNDTGACNADCADTYASIRSEFQCAQGLSYQWDAGSSTPWAYWNSPSNDPCTAPQPGHNSIRQLYYDDTTSMSLKYDLVNNRNIRGVGMWALGFDHGYGDLWGVIAAKLQCPPAPAAHVNTLTGAQTSTGFNVSWALDTGSAVASGYNIFARDSAGGGWLLWHNGPQASRTFYGFAGHTYDFYAQAYGPCQSAPGPTGAQTSTTISPAATKTNGFTSMYSLEAFGGVHGVQSPPTPITSYWSGWQIARSMAPLPSGQGGFVLDGWGGLHPYGINTAAPSGGPYWPNWDIARDLVLLPDGSGGYVLDGWGGLHPFATAGHALPPAATTSGYWPNWDIAKRVVMFSDGTGGYVLDGWGGLHPFQVGGNAMPAMPSITGYWFNWDIARGVALVPGSRAGYVLDGYGGLHQFAGGGSPAPAAVSNNAYWSGWDIARAMVIKPGSTAGAPAGWTVDGWGGVHPFGSAPAVTYEGYFPGWDIVRALVIS